MRDAHWGILYLFGIFITGIAIHQQWLDAKTGAGIIASLTTFLLPSPVAASASAVGSTPAKPALKYMTAANAVPPQPGTKLSSEAQAAADAQATTS